MNIFSLSFILNLYFTRVVIWYFRFTKKNMRIYSDNVGYTLKKKKQVIRHHFPNVLKHMLVRHLKSEFLTDSVNSNLYSINKKK